MSQYQHSYSNYVSHILNNSPSKTTFSFSKADRFPKNKTEQPPLLPTSSSHYFHELHHNTNRSPSKKSPRKQQQRYTQNTFNQQGYYSYRNKETIPAVEREVDHILRKIQRRQNTRSPSKSPYRKHYKEYNVSPNRLTNQTNKKSSNSPQKQRKHSPYRSFYSELIENNHPSKNMTITGYYPVGIEINAQGRYPSSKIKNVVGSKISPPPSKGQSPRKRNEEKIGQDFYVPFSEFGPG